MFAVCNTSGALTSSYFCVCLLQYSNIRIGPVVKKDVMKASTMLEHESQ